MAGSPIRFSSARARISCSATASSTRAWANERSQGFAAPVAVWRVLGETSAETRFAATRTPDRRAFVGRSEESSLLANLWQRACKGEGRALVISGEAGMGKSRLADVLVEQVMHERRYRVTCQCSPYHTNSALHPVVRHLEACCRLRARRRGHREARQARGDASDQWRRRRLGRGSCRRSAVAPYHTLSAA